jgi:hypothetical protein
MELEQVVSCHDERQRSRLNCRAVVQIETIDHRRVKGHMRDIGLHSLYLFTDEDSDDFLIYGEPVSVKVTLRHANSSLSIELDGNIARMDDLGFAVKFAHALKWWPVFTMFPVTEDH